MVGASRRAAAVLCGVVLPVAACTGGEPSDADTDPSEPAEPVSLTLLTHDSFDASKRVLDDFTQETGIEVREKPEKSSGDETKSAPALGKGKARVRG